MKFHLIHDGILGNMKYIWIFGIFDNGIEQLHMCIWNVRRERQGYICRAYKYTIL